MVKTYQITPKPKLVTGIKIPEVGGMLPEEDGEWLDELCRRTGIDMDNVGLGSLEFFDATMNHISTAIGGEDIAAPGDMVYQDRYGRVHILSSERFNEVFEEVKNEKS